MEKIPVNFASGRSEGPWYTYPVPAIVHSGADLASDHV
jgi:hypothetical protein